MTNEMLVMLGFFALQAFFYTMHKVEHSHVWEKLMHSQVILIIFHPVILHGVKDYAIHFVIYSGKVIGAH